MISTHDLKTMKPILIHTHVFYLNIFQQMRPLLDDIIKNYPTECWFTYIEGNEEIQAELKDYEHVLPVSNQGFDIAPYLKVLNQVNLSKYSYIIKLHTKRDVPLGSVLKNCDVGGERWRERLLSFLKPDHFCACMQAFAQDEKLGMVADNMLIFSKEPSDNAAWEKSIALMNQHGYTPKRCAFVAGTMFMCRANLMKFVLEVFSKKEFKPTRREDVLTLAHVAERFMGHAIYAQGYTIRCPYVPKWQQMVFLDYIIAIKRCFFYRKVTTKGQLLIKVCKIPVYHRKIDTKKEPPFPDAMTFGTTSTGAPSVSIIVPCYNQEAYIEECLESVISQNFTDWEMIVVNDGSTDNSQAIVECYAAKYGSKIQLINQKNGGVVAARNTALAAAGGKYILPLDGDDKLAPNCLGRLFDAMQQGLGDVIYGDTCCFGAESGKLDALPPSRINMILDNCVPCSALYRKADALRYGGYDSNMKKGLEDWEFWLNFIEDKRTFHHLPIDVLRYRILPGSRNRSFSDKDYKNLFAYMKKKHRQLFSILPLVRFWKFIFNKKTTRTGRTIIKVCKIPVFIGKKKH